MKHCICGCAMCQYQNKRPAYPVAINADVQGHQEHDCPFLRRQK